MSSLFKKVSITFSKVLSLMLMLLGVGLCLFITLYVRLPSVESLKSVKLQVPMQIVSHDGALMAEYGQKKRIPAKFDHIPKLLIEAVLATEDQRFYDHSGVDFKSLLRAAQEVFKSGRKVQGGSTITMQVARNFFLSPKKTYVRKLNEVILAFKIERLLTKQNILELYLNKIYLGRRSYGVRAAAKNYYGKELNELTLAEIAMIAGLPQSPSRNNPIDNPLGAIKRRNLVLYRMFQRQVIDHNSFMEATLAPNTAKIHKSSVTLKAGYVSELIRQGMYEILGEEAYKKGYQVHSTLDSELQIKAKKSLQEGLQSYTDQFGSYDMKHESIADKPIQEWPKLLKSKRSYLDLEPVVVMDLNYNQVEIMNSEGRHSWVPINHQKLTYQGKHISADQVFKLGDVVFIHSNNPEKGITFLPKVQGAFVSVDTQTGAVLALQGGFSFTRSHFNRVVQAWRQPGSLIKPFLYASALAKGFSLSSTINDGPIVEKSSGDSMLWRPSNDDRKFQGMVSLRDALVRSRNLVSIRLLDYISIKSFKEYLNLFGFSIGKMPKGLSLALGAGEVTPLQVANGYAVIANQGMYQPSYLVSDVTDQSGQKVYFEKNIEIHPGLWLFKPEQNYRVLARDITYLIGDVLRDVIKRGTGRRARVLKAPFVFGKTGTTNKKKDAWFSGFVPGLVSVVWVGYDQSAPLKRYGSQLALPIWLDFMKFAVKKHQSLEWEQPSGIISGKAVDVNGQPYFELYTKSQFDRMNRVNEDLYDDI